ncbi:MAG: hypothetical protein DRJ42_21370 [Deltaproteobacteria bacterium]|nr:MAG: hypothetical protein DRJ42_21370 [Deltaproteobacteria bacterium]
MMDPELQPEPQNEVHDLLEDTSGVVYVEYIIVLTLVTMLGAVSIFSVGMPFYQTFRFTQLLVALPFP